MYSFFCLEMISKTLDQIFQMFKGSAEAQKTIPTATQMVVKVITMLLAINVFKSKDMFEKNAISSKYLIDYKKGKSM